MIRLVVTFNVLNKLQLHKLLLLRSLYLRLLVTYDTEIIIITFVFESELSIRAKVFLPIKRLEKTLWLPANIIIKPLSEKPLQKWIYVANYILKFDLINDIIVKSFEKRFDIMFAHLLSLLSVVVVLSPSSNTQWYMVLKLTFPQRERK